MAHAHGTSTQQARLLEVFSSACLHSGGQRGQLSAALSWGHRGIVHNRRGGHRRRGERGSWGRRARLHARPRGRRRHDRGHGEAIAEHPLGPHGRKAGEVLDALGFGVVRAPPFEGALHVHELHHCRQVVARHGRVGLVATPWPPPRPPRPARVQELPRRPLRRWRCQLSPGWPPAPS